MPFNKTFCFSVVIFLFMVAGCNGISPTETIIKKGRLFKIGENKPYTGTVVGYARDGYRHEKMRYAKRYKNGIRHGDTKYWYANGKLESVEPYINGKINGVFTQYYESGHIKARIHLVDGLRGGSKGEAFWREDEIAMQDFSKRFFKQPPDS